MFSTLDSELYTEAARLPFRLEFDAAAIADQSVKATNLPAAKISPFVAYELGYHIENTMLATFLVQYKLLLAMLPKLKTRYYDLESTFTRAEGELKRAQVRSKIQSLEGALKRR